MGKIAVIGVKEDTGREFLNILCENGVNATDVMALELKAVLGTVVSFGEDDELDIEALEGFDFKRVEAAVFFGAKEALKRYVKKAVDAGIKVIDATGALIADETVPMVIDGVTDKEVLKNTRAVMAASSAVYQVLLPLAEVLKSHKLKRLSVNLFCSASHYGRGGMDELFTQARKIFLNESLADHEAVFKKQIAFNVLPQVGEFVGDETELEWRVNAEIKKVLGGELKVVANAAFVPTFIGDGAFVNAEFVDDVDADELRELMKKAPQVVVFDKTVDGGYVSVDDVQGEDSVYVSRVKQDVSVENGISFWSVADNLRAGSAVNVFGLLKGMGL